MADGEDYKTKTGQKEHPLPYVLPNIPKLCPFHIPPTTFPAGSAPENPPSNEDLNGHHMHRKKANIQIPVSALPEEYTHPNVPLPKPDA